MASVLLSRRRFFGRRVKRLSVSSNWSSTRDSVEMRRGESVTEP